MHRVAHRLRPQRRPPLARGDPGIGDVGDGLALVVDGRSVVEELVKAVGDAIAAVVGHPRGHAKRLRVDAGRGVDAVLDLPFRGHVEAFPGEAVLLVAHAFLADAKPLFRRSRQRDDQARLELARRRGVEPVCVAVPDKACCDRLLVGLAPLFAVLHAVQRQADGADVLALRPLREIDRPGLDLVGDRLAVGQYPPVVGLERHVLAQRVLPRLGGSDGAVGVGQHLDHSRLVAGSKLARAADRALPSPAKVTGDRRRRGGTRGRSSSAASPGGRRRQRSRALLVAAAGDRLAADDLVRRRRLGKRRDPHRPAARLLVEAAEGSRLSTRLGGRADGGARRLDLRHPPGDLRGPVHPASSAAASAGSGSPACRRNLEP